MKHPFLEDFVNWKSCNSSLFSLHDYIFCVLREGQVKPDFLYAILKLIVPTFVDTHGLVFLSETFRESKLQELQAQGYKGKELEYWMNLVSVDAVLGGNCPEIAQVFAEEMVRAWRDRLRGQYPDREFHVRKLEDDGEVYVVFTEAQLPDARSVSALNNQQ